MSSVTLEHHLRVVTFPFGLNMTVQMSTATSVSHSSVFTLCFKKFRRSLGSMARHAWPNPWYTCVCVTVWA